MKKEKEFANRFLENKIVIKIEKFVNWSIPLLVVLLLIAIVIELSTEEARKYDKELAIFDYIIVSFFLVDLTFKWLHTKKLKKFLKLYWIDIIAVFPFYLIFRAYISILEIFPFGESITNIQKITHEATLIREAKFLEEEGKIAKESRFVVREAEVIGRSLRVFQRSLRAFATRTTIAHKYFIGHSIRLHKKKKNS